jgi:hypothetical protein
VSRSPSTRGHVLLGALMVVAGITAMIMVGFEARENDRGREDDALCRLQARMAAESAVAVARSAFARGHAPSTLRGEGWTLAVAGQAVEATGRCAAPRGPAREVKLRVTFDGTGQPLSWD